MRVVIWKGQRFAGFGRMARYKLVLFERNRSGPIFHPSIHNQNPLTIPRSLLPYPPSLI